MDDLKACPFCGEHGWGVHLQKLVCSNENYERWSVICETCGAEISEFSAPERAIKAWNRRVDNG